MRHVTVEDLKKQTIIVKRLPLTDELSQVVRIQFVLMPFGAVEDMTNSVPFIRQEADDMFEADLFEAAYKRFAANINFQLDYVAHITGSQLDDL